MSSDSCCNYTDNNTQQKQTKQKKQETAQTD